MENIYMSPRYPIPSPPSPPLPQKIEKLIQIVQLPGAQEPNISNVKQVRALFLEHTPLTNQIIDIIFDFASYWAQMTFTLETPVSAQHPWKEDIMVLRTLPLGLYFRRNSNCNDYQTYNPNLSDDSGGEEELSWPAPRGENPFRKVEFDIESHDQGWCSSFDPRWGPYDGSFTWFDAYVEHPMVSQTDGSLAPITEDGAISPAGLKWNDSFHTKSSFELQLDSGRIRLMCPDYPTNKELDPPTNKSTHLSRNCRADITPQRHNTTWDFLEEDELSVSALLQIYKGKGKGTAGVDGPGQIIRDLKAGDTISVWARARYPGWVNYVNKVTITVSWAI
jgi:hypothetical protein